jgi:hypothetical protein
MRFVSHKLPVDMPVGSGLADLRDAGPARFRDGVELPRPAETEDRAPSQQAAPSIDRLRVLVWSLFGLVVIGAWAAIISFLL